jgi:hypothetical protein
MLDEDDFDRRRHREENERYSVKTQNPANLKVLSCIGDGRANTSGDR